MLAEAKRIEDFGYVYFFSYSNGGFMAHHMASGGPCCTSTAGQTP